MRCLFLVLAVLAVAGSARAQGTCAGAGCVCDANGCNCPGGCTFRCSGAERCLFASDAGDVTALCLPDSRCDLLLGARTDLTCTSRDRCRGEIGGNSTVFCSGTGECSLGLGSGSTLDCYPDSVSGRCEVFCRGDCLLRCSASNGGDCRRFCADGGPPSPCGTSAFFGCETGCSLLDAGLDAGAVDGGKDAGAEMDGGVADGGFIDAGQADAGLVDAGAVDGGKDAGAEMDGGVADGGFVDAGGADAGLPDAGPSDGGEREPGNYRVGCGCGTIEPFLAAWLVMLGLRRGRRSAW